MEGAVSRTNLWSHSAPRVELDQRSREASLRLEQIERLLRPRARARHFRFWRLFSASAHVAPRRNDAISGASVSVKTARYSRLSKKSPGSGTPGAKDSDEAAGMLAADP